MSQPRLDRLDLHEKFTTLNEHGFTQAAIAEMFGLHLNTVSSIIADPNLEKRHARQARYGRPCRNCGKTTCGSDGRANAPELCGDCAKAEQHQSRYWTRDTIVESFRTFARATGRTPAATDTSLGTSPSVSKKLSRTRRREVMEARRKAPMLPHPYIVQREFGSWRAAVLAAGLEPRPTGSPAHREPRARITRCKRGHDLTDPDTCAIRPDGSRECRLCRNQRARERRERERMSA